MYLFDDLQNEVKRRATRDQSGTEFDTAVKNIINTSLFRVAREANWRTLRRETSFTTVSSQEQHTLPPQVSDRFFLWHENYGHPFVLTYVPDMKFLKTGVTRTETGTPQFYRMWTTEMAKDQPSSASVVQISSSASGDTSIEVTVFGTVSNYPDYEVITTNASNGTTAVNGSKSFTNVDRIVKNGSTTGRITCTTNSAAVTIAVLPVGDTTAGLLYRKVKLYPEPDSAFTMNVWYYKDPYRLVNNGDVHELGHEFDEAIILLSTAKINYEQQKTEGDRFLGLYKEEIKALKRRNVDKIDWFPELERPDLSGGFPMAAPYLSYGQISGGQFGPRVY